MRLRRLLPEAMSAEEAREHYLKAIDKGLLKTMSKMGISTMSSYIGAQIFEAVGLSDEVIEEYFPGTVSRIGGIDVATIERETLMRHQAAYVEAEDEPDLELGGQYQWRLRGERHLHDPDIIAKLQQAARTDDYELYREYARLIDDSADDARHAAPPARVHGPRPHPDRRGRAGRVPSSGASPAAPCPSARSPGRRTRRWPSP